MKKITILTLGLIFNFGPTLVFAQQAVVERLHQGAGPVVGLTQPLEHVAERGRRTNQQVHLVIRFVPRGLPASLMPV